MKVFAIGVLFLAVSGFSTLTGCASSTGTTATPLAASSESYRVGPSDELNVRVLPDPAIDLPELHVRPDGMISVELIGDVPAAGRTTDEIAAEIQQRMEQYRQAPSVSVSVVTPSSTTVSVIGEVKDAGNFPLDRDIRVAEIIAMAGDATELAATSRVRVVRRQGDQTILYLVNLDQIRGCDGSTDMLLKKGDLVVVPAAKPVVDGNKLRRALYPIEALFRIVGSALLLGLVN
jgi:polysaccharide export outer membrane protein